MVDYKSFLYKRSTVGKGFGLTRMKAKFLMYSSCTRKFATDLMYRRGTLPTVIPNSLRTISNCIILRKLVQCFLPNTRLRLTSTQKLAHKTPFTQKILGNTASIPYLSHETPFLNSPFTYEKNSFTDPSVYHWIPPQFNRANLSIGAITNQNYQYANHRE